MNILLTNDDGIFAPGLKILAEGLINEGHNVTIFAPDRQNSGKSHSITLGHSLVVEKTEIEGLDCICYSVTGTPADCIRAAMQVSDTKYDFCFSGCNYGYNAGKDISYSGTVSAAIEANFYNIPSFAVSVDFDRITPHFDTACYYAIKIFNDVKEMVKYPAVININSPSIDIKSVKGIKVCSTGSSITDKYDMTETEKGYELKLVGRNFIKEKDYTDRHYLEENFITVTPLVYNLDDDAMYK